MCLSCFSHSNQFSTRVPGMILLLFHGEVEKFCRILHEEGIAPGHPYINMFNYRGTAAVPCTLFSLSGMMFCLSNRLTKVYGPRLQVFVSSLQAATYTGKRLGIVISPSPQIMLCTAGGGGGIIWTTSCHLKMHLTFSSTIF